jgi:hypothetical protein
MIMEKSTGAFKMVALGHLPHVIVPDLVDSLDLSAVTSRPAALGGKHRRLPRACVPVHALHDKEVALPRASATAIKRGHPQEAGSGSVHIHSVSISKRSQAPYPGGCANCSSANKQKH